MSNNVRLNEKLSPPPVKKSLRVREVSASNLLWPAKPGWLPVKAGLMDVRVVACGFSVSRLSNFATSSRFHDDDDYNDTHIAANRELSSDQITICLKAQESEQERKVVANIVNILLRIDQFIEGRDTISCKETMLYPLHQRNSSPSNVWGSLNSRSQQH